MKNLVCLYFAAALFLFNSVSASTESFSWQCFQTVPTRADNHSLTRMKCGGESLLVAKAGLRSIFFISYNSAYWEKNEIIIPKDLNLADFRCRRDSEYILVRSDKSVDFYKIFKDDDNHFDLKFDLSLNIPEPATIRSLEAFADDEFAVLVSDVDKNLYILREDKDPVLLDFRRNEIYNPKWTSYGFLIRFYKYNEQSYKLVDNVTGAVLSTHTQNSDNIIFSTCEEGIFEEDRNNGTAKFYSLPEFNNLFTYELGDTHLAEVKCIPEQSGYLLKTYVYENDEKKLFLTVLDQSGTKIRQWEYSDDSNLLNYKFDETGRYIYKGNYSHDLLSGIVLSDKIFTDTSPYLGSLVESEILTTTSGELFAASADLWYDGIHLASYLPEPRALEIEDISPETAVCSGRIYKGIIGIKKLGVCWNINGSPTTDDNKKEEDKEKYSFEIKIENLLPDTEYFVKSYIITVSGETIYGDEVSFKTLSFSKVLVSVFPENAGITIPGTGTHLCYPDSIFNITAVPAEHFRFLKWGTYKKVNISSGDIESATTSAKVSGDGELLAIFIRPDRPTARVNISTDPYNGGYTYPPDEFLVNRIIPFSITAAPADNRTFLRWEVSSGVVSIKEPFKVSTSAEVLTNADITAIFMPTEDVTTLTLSAAEGGRVDPEGTINGGKNKYQKIKAVSDENSFFYNWETIDGDAYIGNISSSVTRVKLKDNSVTLKARFLKNFNCEGVKINIKSNSDNLKRNRIRIKNMPLNSEQNSSILPEDNLIHVDGNLFDFDGADYRVNDKSTFYKIRNHDTGNFSLHLNHEKNVWSLKGSGITARNFAFHAIDGIDFIYNRNDIITGCNLNLSEKAILKFNSDKNYSSITNISKQNFSLKVEIKKMIISYNTNQKRNFIFIPTSKFVPNANWHKSFPTDADIMVSFDNFIISVPAVKYDEANWSSRNAEEYTYTGITANGQVKLKINIIKRTWSFKLRNADFADDIDYSDGIDVSLNIGQYQGGLKLDPTIQTKFFSE